MGDWTPDPPARPVRPPRVPPVGYPDCCAEHRAMYDVLEAGQPIARQRRLSRRERRALARSAR